MTFRSDRGDKTRHKRIVIQMTNGSEDSGRPCAPDAVLDPGELKVRLFERTCASRRKKKKKKEKGKSNGLYSASALTRCYMRCIRTRVVL
jgi:hypothetical protein